MNILISALGAQPDIIEETIGFFNHSNCADFYKGDENITKLRQQIEPVDELWLIATDRQRVDKPSYTIKSVKEDFDTVSTNCKRYGCNIRIFVLKGIDDIMTVDQAHAFHDLTLRVVAFAQSKLNGGKLYLSLACGRKTMSSDMEDAARCFGCNMLLHVLGNNKKDAQPMLMGAVQKNEALKPLQTTFTENAFLTCEPCTQYLEDIESQKRQAEHFFTSYYLEEKETRSNFHILYTLPPSKIKQLKDEKIGISKENEKEELEWLRILPKTDLHCHLGGVLSPAEMIEVAKCYLPLIEEETKYNQNYKEWFEQLKTNPTALLRKVTNWKEWIKARADELDVEKGLVTAAVLLSYEDRSDVNFQRSKVLHEALQAQHIGNTIVHRKNDISLIPIPITNVPSFLNLFNIGIPNQTKRFEIIQDGVLREKLTFIIIVHFKFSGTIGNEAAHTMQFTIGQNSIEENKSLHLGP